MMQSQNPSSGKPTPIKSSPHETEGSKRWNQSTRAAAAPSSASLLVSGTPADIGRVRAFLGYLNREVLRPVTLSVHVYAVSLEREATGSASRRRRGG